MKIIKPVRGTDKEAELYIIPKSELSFIIDKRELRIGDGKTPKGLLVGVVPNFMDENCSMTIGVPCKLIKEYK